MADTQLSYSSTHLTDLTTRRCQWTNEDGRKRYRQRQQPIADVLPEETMSAIEQYIGDGGGRVSIGAELSNNENFKGAKSFVNISVTCNNDIDSCLAVHDLVQPVVRQLVNQDLQMMLEDRDAQAAPNPAAAEPGRVSPGPPVATPRPATSAMAPRPINPVRPPSFRR